MSGSNQEEIVLNIGNNTEESLVSNSSSSRCTEFFREPRVIVMGIGFAAGVVLGIILSSTLGLISDDFNFRDAIGLILMAGLIGAFMLEAAHYLQEHCCHSPSSH